jgi:plasmid stability protein
MMAEFEQVAKKSAGRPRKYPAGRANFTVRFTPERAAALQEAAAAHGQSVSAEVEDLVTQALQSDLLQDQLSRLLKALRGMQSATLDAHFREYAAFATQQHTQLQDEIASLRHTIASLQRTIDDQQRERGVLMHLLQDALKGERT